MAGRYVQPADERSKAARIARLRERLAKIEGNTPFREHSHPLFAVIKGILDLLEDEL